MTTNNDLQQKLQKIGLSKQEAVVYLVCLRNPKMTPSKLANITNIKRTSLYPILQELLDKNLIYKKTFTKKKFIFAHPPRDAMQSIIKQTQKKADDITTIAKILTKKLESKIEQPILNTNTGALFLSGKPGVRELVKIVLNEKQDIYWLGPSKMFTDLDESQQIELFQRLSVKRMENGTTAYAMTDNKFKTNSLFYGGSEKFRQLRTIVLPETLDSLLIVTGNLCGFIKSTGSKSKVTLFRDAEYSNLLRFTLELVWKSL